ncbi:MAG: hypothetical protein E7258_09730 [Lachnospiraceae bacterium]|nr:hypothetical protein [Lachnospiraceae bacterium]
MNISNYQNMYNKIEIPAEMDKKIKESIAGRLESKRKISSRKFYRTGFAVAAAFAFIVCITNIDSVVAGAKNIIEYLKYTFVVDDKDGTTEEVNLVGEFMTISPDAPKEKCYMDSISYAKDELGIALLDTDEACLYEGGFEYTPYLTDDKDVYGLILSNKLYATGDLKDCTIHVKEDENGVDWMEYEAGDKYQTPISVEITVRTDKDMTGMYDNNEIGYVSENKKIDLSATGNTFDAEVYELENLGVKAVLYSVETDGPASWNVTSGSITCTTAVLVYQGVEYSYLGGVDRDTMKMFLDTLK